VAHTCFRMLRHHAHILAPSSMAQLAEERSSVT
jgi:hypothetical protein